jgi:hypothetical protein
MASPRVEQEARVDAAVVSPEQKSLFDKKLEDFKDASLERFQDDLDRFKSSQVRKFDEEFEKFKKDTHVALRAPSKICRSVEKRDSSMARAESSPGNKKRKSVPRSQQDDSDSGDGFRQKFRRGYCQVIDSADGEDSSGGEPSAEPGVRFEDHFDTDDMNSDDMQYAGKVTKQDMASDDGYLYGSYPQSEAEMSSDRASDSDRSSGRASFNHPGRNYVVPSECEVHDFHGADGYAPSSESD